MSKRALDLVKKWAEDHIRARYYVNEEAADNRPTEYAERCLAKAQGKGIPAAEVESSVGDLESYMARALNTADKSEVDRVARHRR